MKTYLGSGRKHNIVWYNTQYGRTAVLRLTRQECRKVYSLDPVYVDSLSNLFDKLGWEIPDNLRQMSEKDACSLQLALIKKLRERR